MPNNLAVLGHAGRYDLGITRALIDDPQAQDEAVLAQNKGLGYVAPQGSLLQLIELSQKLHYFGSLIKYFYRAVGTATFAHPFATYQALMTQLDTVVLHSEEQKAGYITKKFSPLTFSVEHGTSGIGRGQSY